MTPLGLALRKKFATPQAAMQALGLDAELLTGRAGSDVVVGDSILETSMKRKAPLSRTAALAKGALAVFLKPKLAMDAKIDLVPILAGVTTKNWKTEKPKIIAAIGKAAAGKLATDADLDDMPAMLDDMDAEQMPDDNVGSDNPDRDLDGAADPGGTQVDAKDDSPVDAVLALLKGKIDDGLYAQVEALCQGEGGDAAPDADALLEQIRGILGAKAPGAMDAPPATKGAPAAPATSGKDPKAMIDKPAMDAAIKTAVDAAVKKVREESSALVEARELVRPHLGEVAVDTAEAAYKLALDHAGVDIEGVPPAAYKAMVGMLTKRAAPATVSTATLAADAANTADFTKRYPSAAAVRLLG